MEHTFYVNNMDQQQFINYVNAWFFNNRNIMVTKLFTTTNTKFGFLVNKSALSDLTIIYDQNSSYNNLYGLDYNEKFALMKISMETMVENWKKANPHLQAVTYSYNYHGRGQSGSLWLNGIGANNRNQLWLIYRVPQNTAPPAPSPKVEQAAVPQTPVIPETPTAPQAGPRRCGNCGYTADAAAKFCAACGAKI